MYHNDFRSELVRKYVPLILPKVLLKLPNSILTCKVTGNRLNRCGGYVLEVPVTYICRGLEKAVAWIQRKISEEIKITEKVKNKCLK